MRVRPLHVAVAVLTALAAVTSVSAANATDGPPADRAVSRFVAYQACQSAMWKWTAGNAKIGTSVGGFRHDYRAQDVWREGQGWHVQVGGKRGQVVTANNDAAYCVITGTDARPKLTRAAFPR